MNHIKLYANFAITQCRRFIAFQVSNLREAVSTLQTINYTQAVDNFAQRLTARLRHADVIHMLDLLSTLLARASKGSGRAPKRIARPVAIVIGISLSMQTTAVGIGSIDPYYDLHSLANYQLTDKQYDCHNDIVFRESSFRINARNGSHHGYYQIRNEKLIDAPYDYQFYFYWKYVQHRYGITQYDEPDYCKALNHLVTRGWQ
jgi:hypothetical protein